MTADILFCKFFLINWIYGVQCWDNTEICRFIEEMHFWFSIYIFSAGFQYNSNVLDLFGNFIIKSKLSIYLTKLALIKFSISLNLVMHHTHTIFWSSLFRSTCQLYLPILHVYYTGPSHNKIKNQKRKYTLWHR